MAKINGTTIQEMVRHWLSTPVCGYLGSDYGQDLKSLLQNPQAYGRAEAYLAKLKADIAILQGLGADEVNLYAQTSGADKLRLFIEVAGRPIEIEA